MKISVTFLEHGTGNLFYLLVRGFSTGAMHITCAFIIRYGLRVFRRPAALKASGIFAVVVRRDYISRNV